MLAVVGLAASASEATGSLAGQFAFCQAAIRSDGLPLHLEHLPERLGLLVILVLGESIAAVAVGVQETHWKRATVTVAILGFVAAVSLWWTYFDLAGAAATHTLVERAGHRSTLLHDVYAYGHWPLTLGLAAAGVGLEARSWKAASRPSPPTLVGSCGVG